MIINKILKENLNSLYYKKVGEKYDNNKELDNKNYEYFMKAMKKILSLNYNEDIDYNLCELLITLSIIIYTMKNKDEKKDKNILVMQLKKTSLMKKYCFWVGLTKYELNEGLLREKNKDINLN